MFLSLEFIQWVLPDGAERLGFAVEQLLAASLRVRAIADRLQETAARTSARVSIDAVVDDLQYHGEAYLNAVYELRNRVIFLEAVMTGCDAELLDGQRWPYQVRRTALNDLKRANPRATMAVDALLQLEGFVCPPVRHRNTMVHESFLSLGLVYYLEGQTPDDAGANAGTEGQVIHDIAEFLRAARKDSDRYARFFEAFRRAVVRFASQRVRDSQAMDAAVERVHAGVVRFLESAGPENRGC